jgi:hypothetical protein
MAENTAPNGPAYIQANSHNSQVLRQFIQTAATAGVRSTGALAVAQRGAGANMSVDVAAGHAVVLGTSSPNIQGAYHVYNDATVNLAIAASDATNPRNDLVVATVRDNSYGSGSNDWLLQVITGTPNASPVDPATPATSLVLARVSVAALSTTVVTANITDLRTYTVPNRSSVIGKVALTSNSAAFSNGSFTTIAGTTAGVNVLANRRIQISVHANVTSTVAADVIQLAIYRDATQIDILTVQQPSNTSYSSFVNGTFIDDGPTAGAHAYYVAGNRAAGTGSASLQAGVAYPFQLIVEDVGPV